MSSKKQRKEAEKAAVDAAAEQAPIKIPRWMDVPITVNPGPRGHQTAKLPMQVPPGQPPMIVPVSFTIPEAAKDGDKMVVRMTLTGPPEALPPPPTQTMLGGLETEEWNLREQFHFRRMPWWVVFVMGVYGVFKLFELYGSPCAVLGVASPVDKRAVTKAYRGLSMCTHPDRMTGKDSDAKARGEILFTRMTKARDELNDFLDHGGRNAGCTENPNCEPVRKQIDEKDFLRRCSKPQKHTFRDGSETALLRDLCPCSCKSYEHPEGGVESISCYSTMIEVQIVEFLYHVPDILSQASGQDVWAMGDLAKDFAYGLVTLEAGVMGTISSVLFLSMVWRMLMKPLAQFFYQGTVFQSAVSAPTLLVFGPIPTVYRFLASPFVRWKVFMLKEALPRLMPEEEEERGGEEEEEDKPVRAQVLKEGGGANAAMDAKLRNRKAKKVSDATAEKTKEELMLGKGLGGTAVGRTEAEGDEDEAGEPSSSSLKTLSQKSLEELVERRPAKLKKADEERLALHGVKGVPKNAAQWRRAGASAIKFEFVLTLTKNLVPLAMVIATGQVFNGLPASMAIGYFIRNYIPEMRAETLHLWLFLAGYLHTLLSSEHSISHSAEEVQLITLQWQWSSRDVVTLANLAQLGATFAAASQCGNEPGFVTTFAAGVSMRYQTFTYTAKWSEQLYSMSKQFFDIDQALPGNLRLATLEEVATQSGGGVGDCGGGPLRVIFGTAAPMVAMALKLTLLLLPALHASMWVIRTLPSRKTGKRSCTVARTCMALVTGLQCVSILGHNFDGIQGHMAGFWVMLLLGTLWESLLCTYDIRGQGRQLLYLIIFIML